MIYTTLQLYRTTNLKFLADLPYKIALVRRIDILEKTKTIENSKHYRHRDEHLIKKICDAQDFYQARLKEIT